MQYILKYAHTDDIALRCSTLEDLSLYLERDINSVYGSVWRLSKSGKTSAKVINYDGILFDLLIDDDVKQNFATRPYTKYKNIILINEKTNEKFECRDLWKVSKILDRPYSGVRKSVYNLTRTNSNIINDSCGNKYYITFDVEGR